MGSSGGLLRWMPNKSTSARSGGSGAPRFWCVTALCGWWYLAWVWVGGRRRRRPSQLSLSFRVDRLFSGQMDTALLLNSLSPTDFVDTLPHRSFLGARLSLTPPPPPFPVQPYVSHHPPYERESSVVCVLASTSRWPRPSCRLPDAGLRPCPPPPLPTPWPSSSGSSSALNRAICCV